MSGLCHAALVPAAYASRIVLPPSLQGSLPAGWLSLYREGVEPSGSLQKVSDHPSSFSGLSLAQGKFHFEPPFTSFDYLVSAREQCRRHLEAERLGGRQVDDEIELRRLTSLPNRLLRARRERPRGHRAAEKRDELAAP